MAAEVIHDCPRDGESVTPCCGRSPHELPRTGRITLDPVLLTCGVGSVVVTLRLQGVAQFQAELRRVAQLARALLPWIPERRVESARRRGIDRQLARVDRRAIRRERRAARVAGWPA